MRNDDLVLGSDIETFYMSTKLNVFMPKGEALRAIVNYVDPIRAANSKKEFLRLGVTKEVEPFKIGTVRYTSTDRLNRNNPEDLVPFMIQPSDFLARRTAVLGMTRTGKSNMIKQTVSVVKKIMDKCGLKIGQIIFDINGEYANANKQDEGSIAELYKDDCVRYRMVNTLGFKPLLNNFYEQIEEGYSVICEFLKDGGSKAADVQQFMNLSFDKPDEPNEIKKWERKIALYKTILFAAGFKPADNYKVKFEANEKVRSIIDQEMPSPFNPKDGISLKQAKYWFELLRKFRDKPDIQEYLVKEIEVGSGGNDFDIADKITASNFRQKKTGEKTHEIESKPEVSLPTPNEVFMDETVKKKLSEIIDEINATYNKNFDVDVATKSALQMRDILLKNGHLRDSARNNSLKDFRFAYFDAVQDALIAGYEQNQDFFALLLDNDEKKRELMQVFLEDIYKKLRES